MIHERGSENENLVRSEQKRVLDLMGDLEKKMDHRGQEITDDLRQELERLIA